MLLAVNEALADKPAPEPEPGPKINTGTAVASTSTTQGCLLVPLHKSQSTCRGALRGTPGSACPQPEPIATELPSCAPISARAAQRRRRRRWWRGKKSARRPGPKAQVLLHVLWHVLRHVLRRVLYVLALHVSTATATGPAAPTKGFKRSKSAWRDDEKTVDEETLGGVGVGGSWGQATSVDIWGRRWWWRRWWR